MLPRSVDEAELWPTLLAKAVYKLQRDATGVDFSTGLGSAAHAFYSLTGWLPQVLGENALEGDPLDGSWAMLEGIMPLPPPHHTEDEHGEDGLNNHLDIVSMI